MIRIEEIAHYVCMCMHVDGGSPQARYLDRTVLFHRIEDLRPEATYTVSIHAVYGNTEGPEISLSQLTGKEGRGVPR